MLQQLVDRFIAVPLVGLDLGSSRLKAIEVAASGGRIILRRCAVVSAESGDPAGALAQLVREVGMPSARVAVGLASPSLIVKPWHFPRMPKKELANAIQFEAEHAILNGHALKDMFVDWHPLPSNSGESLRGLLAVVPQAVVAARLQVFIAAGLHPLLVDVEGLALWNAYWVLVGKHEPSPKTVLLINVGAQTTNLIIASGPDALLLLRDLQLGAKALEAGRSLDWVTEVRDSIGYARSQAGLRALDTAYVTGGGSGPTLIPLLKAAVPAPATFWNPLKQLGRDAGSPSVEESVGPLLAVAIGLALRQPT